MAKQKRKQEREKVLAPEKVVKKTCLNCNHKFTTGMNGYCSACVELVVTGREQLQGREKCVVAGCENHTDQGEFVGSLCFPCHDFLSNVSSPFTSSQAYRNEQARFYKKVADKLTEVVSPFFSEHSTYTGQVSLADSELANLVKENERG